MALHYRTALLTELAHAEALVAQSINDLTRRHGFGEIAQVRPPDFQAFCVRDDPRGAWVAEEGDVMVGFALSWVCDDHWFLAELFVSPDHQGQGIGQALMARTLAQAADVRAKHRSLITFAFNVVSQAVYVQHGLLPRLPLLLCSAPRAAMASMPRGPWLEASPVGRSAADAEALRAIDLASVGFSREKHHRYLLSDAQLHGFFFTDKGARTGYAYLSKAGHIGPLAVLRAEAMPAAFQTAVALAAESGAAQVSAFVPGTSAALPIAVAQGMRFALPMVLMSAEDFGHWRAYLPRNPGFM